MVTSEFLKYKSLFFSDRLIAELFKDGFEIDDFKGTGISIHPVYAEVTLPVCKEKDSETELETIFFQSFLENMKTHKTCLGPFICGVCGRQYTNRGTLLRHKRYECSRERQFQCQYCLKKFFRKAHLSEHITYVHFGGKRVYVKE